MFFTHYGLEVKAQWLTNAIPDSKSSDLSMIWITRNYNLIVRRFKWTTKDSSTAHAEQFEIVHNETKRHFCSCHCL